MDIFVLFSFVLFFDHFACVKANCKKLGTGVYFYWNFTISPSFKKKKKYFALGTKKMSPLKPIKTAIFNPQFS